MTNWQSFPIEFKGGLRGDLTPLQQGLNAIGTTTVHKNYEPTKDGGYRRIKGYEKFLDAEVTGSGDILGIVPVSASEIVVARKNGGGVTAFYLGDASSYTLKATGASLGTRVNYVEADFTGTKKTILVDGVNLPAEYDHTAKTVTYFSAPGVGEEDYDGASCVEVFKQAAFYGNGHFVVFTAPSTVDDFTSASGAGVINVGDTVVGLKTFRDQLIVFCETKILRITGNSSADYQLVPITEDLGCTDGFTIQEFGGDVIYLAPDGIRLLSATDRIGDFGLDVASNLVAEVAKSFVQSHSVFCSLVQREKSQYRIFGFTSNRDASLSQGLAVVKKIDQGAEGLEWCELKGFKANVASSQYNANAERFFFGGSDGYVYEMDSGNSFDGSTIESVIETPFHPITDPQTRKTLYRINTYIDASGPFSIDLNVKYDYNKFDGISTISPPTDTIESEGEVSLYGVALYGVNKYGGNINKVYRNTTRGSGYSFAIRLTDNTSTSQYTLDSIVVEFAEWDRK